MKIISPKAISLIDTISDIAYKGNIRSRETDMTFEEAKAIQTKLNSEVAAASAALQVFPKGRMGLTPDEVKSSPEFRAAMQRYNASFLQFRSINGLLTRKFSNELREERRTRRAG
jgi:hypothetical protein